MVPVSDLKAEPSEQNHKIQNNNIANETILSSYLRDLERGILWKKEKQKEN